MVAERDTSVAVTADDLRNEWEYEDFDPREDAFLVDEVTINIAISFSIRQNI
jgi:hypothetical protein